jgi:hypothetical protein
MIDYIGISKDMIDDLEQIKCLLAEKHEQGLEVFRLELFGISPGIIAKTLAGQPPSPPSLLFYVPPALPTVTPPPPFCATQGSLPSPPTLTIFFHFHHQPKLKGNFSPKIKSKSRSKSHPSGILTQIRHGTRIFS